MFPFSTIWSTPIPQLAQEVATSLPITEKYGPVKWKDQTKRTMTGWMVHIANMCNISMQLSTEAQWRATSQIQKQSEPTAVTLPFPSREREDDICWVKKNNLLPRSIRMSSRHRKSPNQDTLLVMVFLHGSVKMVWWKMPLLPLASSSQLPTISS